MTEMIAIDGSKGEGGGQILRSALTMSLMTRLPFTMVNIRAQRKNPGLQPQHLAAVEAAAKISDSRTEGAALYSKNLTFLPGAVRAGNYHFKVPTAGSMPLVLQTVALPLAFAEEISCLDFSGGTHVPWAPTYDYLELVWARLLKSLGMDISLEIHQAGYYPKGQGRFSVLVSPVKSIKPLTAVQDVWPDTLKAVGVVSNLPDHIVHREFAVLKQKTGRPMEEEVREYPSCQPGNALILIAGCGRWHAGFSNLGEKGVPAEKVAEAVAADFRDFCDSRAPIDRHLADQLLLPLIFAEGPSTYRAQAVTQHLLTNAATIGLFRRVHIQISGTEGKPGVIDVRPLAN